MDRRLAARALLGSTPLVDDMADRIEAALGTVSDLAQPHLAWLLGEIGEGGRRRASPGNWATAMSGSASAPPKRWPGSDRPIRHCPGATPTR